MGYTTSNCSLIQPTDAQNTEQNWHQITLQYRINAYNAVYGNDDGTGIHCSECRDKGTIAFISPTTGHFTVRQCKCYGTRLTINRLKRCGVWNQVRHYKLENFIVQSEAQKTLKSVVENYLADTNGHWLMLCGQSGAGKTHLCTAAFAQLTYRKGLAGEYFLWNRDGRRLKASVLEDPENLWERYSRTELLYIDDLFKGTCSEADRRMAFELLDYRYNNGLTTILSSEWNIDQIVALDEAIAGRIIERCGPFLVNIAPDKDKNYRVSVKVG